ncbi:hypothetical protein C8J57DRAFT_1458692 [Mycena rebaudengoi]|nr:hypothetical protein C8J57DRAFT_1458692 [Mycena rebaudengoi]
MAGELHLFTCSGKNAPYSKRVRQFGSVWQKRVQVFGSVCILDVSSNNPEEKRGIDKTKINHSFNMKHMLPHIPQHIPLRLAPRPQAVFLQHAPPGTAYRVERLPGIGVSSLLWCSLGARHANREATTCDPPGCKLERMHALTQHEPHPARLALARTAALLRE